MSEFNPEKGQRVLATTLASLEVELEHARKHEREIVDLIHRGRYESPEAAEDIPLEEKRLIWRLERIYRTMMMAFDVAGLSATRMDFERDWKNHVSAGLGRFEHIDEIDVTYSLALSFLSDVLFSIKTIATKGESPVDSYKLQRLEELLRDTAHLVERSGVRPQNEADIQRAMDDYLGVVFTDYAKPTITGIIKNFKPDGGIQTLHAAIEFKFARSKQEVRTAISGIFEDTAGYKGSADWTRFYSVIYQTEPFESEARIRDDMRRVGAVSWTPILVTGRSK
ncbi:hypothetical protein [Myxococcus faecalis]|uniref:hypothetical protein n=1 Tax=Myxococcus faecalis TaxID=3115646 RepID=UPI003CEBA9D8